MPTGLQGRAPKAHEPPQHRFGNLYEVRNEAFLPECWRDIRQEAADGVDGVRAQDSAAHLDANIHALVERLTRQQSRAKHGRRTYIPQGNGPLRPLGMPAVEEQFLHRAVTRILTALYEQDFLRCRYGYRPHLGAQEAVAKLTLKLQCGPDHVVVEADLQGFFDTINPDWMLRMWQARMEAGAFLRLIQKWLKAGGLETDGTVLPPASGTPQGGIVSPVLAHGSRQDYARDWWFHTGVRPRCQGEACLMRYADAGVCAFQHQDAAERFSQAGGQRLGQFGLALAADKARGIPCSQRQALGTTSVDFLGFEFRWGRDRKGQPHLKRRTARKKLRDSLKRFTAWCKDKCRG